MIRRFSANFAVFSIFLDFVLIALSLWVAVVIRVPLNYLTFLQTVKQPIQLPLFLYVLFPLFWVGILMLFSVYDGRKNLKAVNEFSSLLFGSALATVSLAGLLYLSYRDVSRFLFLFFIVLAFGLICGWRVIFRLSIRRRMLRGLQHRRVLILGAGRVGRELLEHLLQQPDSGIRLIGYLDDDPQKQATCRDVFGPLDRARDVILSDRVDEVVIALPRSAYERLNFVVSSLHDLPVRVWIIPDYFSLALHKARVDEFAGIPMLDLRAPALTEYQRMVKRAFDLIVCTLSLPGLIPVMALIALCIRLDSEGPVFFLQTRVGENGKLFHMVKFRTMVKDADKLRHLVEKIDENGNLIHKSPSDPRITRMGKILRKTSLDELPQVINIFRGEMSLVGPRPELPYLVEKYNLWQRKRFAVPQGLTGWWQVNGRSDKPMHLHTEDDLYYVQNYSIWLDLKIIMMTVGVVIKGRGAY